MLVALRIRHLAVIDDERIPFHAGLNVVTGETGVGKSLLFDSLAFLFGERPRSRTLAVRAGAPSGGVEGTFEIEGPTRARVDRVLESAIGEGLLGADGLLVIQRDVDSNGRTRQRVNHASVTAAFLKELRVPLIEVHGQSEEIGLLEADAARRTLDEIASLEPRIEAFRARFAELGALRREALAAEGTAREREERLDFLRFQSGEIALVDPKAGEHEALRERRTRLRHAEKIRAALASACGALADEEGAATERIHAAVALVRGVLPFASELPSIEADLAASATAVAECARALRGLAESVESEPGEAEAIEERLDALERLFRRYGPSEAEVLERREAIDAELAGVESGAAPTQAEILDRAGALEEALRREAREISRARSAAATRLRKDVEAELALLGMKGARFVPRVEPLGGAELSPTGADAVEFLFGANQGEPERPLHQAASGGELSRVMLALKSCLAARERVPLLVFDEIDSNVGGRLGDVLGRKLVALAAGRQVLVATHLPQVAAFADNHVRVRKEVRGGKTFARFETLDAERRVLEIAEMIRGKGRTDVTLAEAGEMIASARSRGGAAK